MRISAFARAGLGLGFLGMAAFAAAAPDGGYNLLHTYKFGSAPGATREYFDYITVDSAARRVYLSHGTEVKVIDADRGASVGDVTGLKLDHGVALAPEFGRGFITDGEQGKVIFFDLKTLQMTGEAKAAPDADCVVYDPASKRVFSMNGDSMSSTAIDAKSGDVVGTIPLGGSPEFAVADGKGTIFANIADKDEIVAIDTQALKVKSRWPTGPEGEPTALAIDREHRLIFSAGRKPQVLAVFDADSGKVIASFPIAGGVDAAAYDPGTGLIFASTREGTLHVLHEDSPKTFSTVEDVKTEVGAKTMGLDTKTHNVFLDTADFGAPVAGAPGRAPRPQAVLGTFRVLVYGR
jgi:DNA-binding beta-propeller fold protein YncE